jgi:GH15 family glucan-1,4-alpha-glucosidase
MPRDLPLSNGRLHVAFDRQYVLRDIYFPRVGKENHAVGRPFRFGVFVDGKCRWMGPDWELDMRYAEDSMSTEVTAVNHELGISLSCADAVDFFENVLVRRVLVHNLADHPREIRLFYHHNFRILGHEVGDTAMFSPESGSLIHYKDDRYFLMNCRIGDQFGMTSYACGTKDVGSAEGTWRDAEDGNLSGNAIAQGSVDSTMGIALTVGANAERDVYYWMAAGRDMTEVTTIDQVVRTKTPEELLRRTRHYWQLWVSREQRATADLPASVVERYRQSLLIIRSHVDHDGAVIAATDSDIAQIARDTYAYMWPRDGALVMSALMSTGHMGAATKFFEFCAKAVTPEGYLRHKYNPDGMVASSWHGAMRDGHTVLPIQEDETALVVWAVWQYFTLFQRVEETAPFYRALVTRPADFLLRHVDQATGLPLPSWDLWEERWGVHFYTVCTVISGLRAAAQVASAFGEEQRAARCHAGAERMVEAMMSIMWSEKDQRFARMATPGLNGYTLDMTIDSALYALTEFSVLAIESPYVSSTLRQVEERLWVQTDIGGLARYENDYYHQVEKTDTKRVPGNPWFICTLWMARYHVMRARSTEELSKARQLLEWAADRAFTSGVMAEQLDPYTGEPLSVSPLTWSHAAYVRAVREYMVRAGRFSVCPTCGQETARLGRLTDILRAVP